MTAQNAPADTSPAVGIATPARPVPVPAPPSWAWRRAALFLAGAAQLITISALNSADPLPVTWASLLLAIAPAPLAAALWTGFAGPGRPHTEMKSSSSLSSAAFGRAPTMDFTISPPW